MVSWNTSPHWSNTSNQFRIILYQFTLPAFNHDQHFLSARAVDRGGKEQICGAGGLKNRIFSLVHCSLQENYWRSSFLLLITRTSFSPDHNLSSSASLVSSCLLFLTKNSCQEPNMIKLARIFLNHHPLHFYELLFIRSKRNASLISIISYQLHQI